MKQHLFALSLGIGAMVFLADRALGQGAPQCGARDRVVAELAEAYGETRRALGLAANSAVVEVFVSDATGTWTITATLADGTTCLVASGRNWETAGTAAPPPGDPA